MGGTKLVLTLGLVVAALGLAACGDDDEDEGGTTTGAEEVETTAGGDETGTSVEEGGEQVLIKTLVAPTDPEEMGRGEVLPASTIGDSAFCSGGTFRDAPIEAAGAPMVRQFSCPGGSLTINFSPTGSGRTLSGDWEVVRGSGSFEGLSGGGRMRVVFESAPDQPARETFTGTVSG